MSNKKVFNNSLINYSLQSNSSLAELSDYDGSLLDLKNQLSFIKAEEEHINKDNIWNYTILNVFSSTICLISLYFIDAINLAYVGHALQSEINIESIGVGQLILNSTTMLMLIGGLGGLDTIGSFCYGSQDYYGLGIVTVRMRILITLYYLFITVPVCCFSGAILQALGVNTDIAQRVGDYTYTMLPALFFLFNFNLNIRYFQVMHSYVLPCMISLILMFSHYLLNYLTFVFVDKFLYIYVVYNTIVSTFIGFSLTTILAIFFNPKIKSLMYWDDNILNKNDFILFSKLCLFSGLAMFGDFVGYELVTFLGCYMPSHEMNSSSLIIRNYSLITGFFYSGSSLPLGQIVAFCFGKNDHEFYKFVIRVYAKLNLVIALCITTFTILFKEKIIDFYTDNTRITEISVPIVELFAFFCLLDNFSIMSQSILRGSGAQHISSVVNVCITFFITLPIALIMGFLFNFGVLGLWMGIFSYMAIGLCINGYFAWNLNFKEMSKKIKRSLKLDSSSFISETQEKLLDNEDVEVGRLRK